MHLYTVRTIKVKSFSVGAFFPPAAAADDGVGVDDDHGRTDDSDAAGHRGDTGGGIRDSFPPTQLHHIATGAHTHAFIAYGGRWQC